MVEPLLRRNFRIAILLIGMAVLVIVVGGIMLACAGDARVMQVAGWTLLLLGLALFLSTLWMNRRPRLGYYRGTLLVYLRGGRPIQIPIDVVEVFFLGQGPALGNEPRNRGANDGFAATNVVVRLAEAATQWHGRDVNVALGVWQDGYVTVRGLWCEPLNAEVLQRLNRRLMEIKRERRRQRTEVVP